MNPYQASFLQSRRRFFTSAASGLGLAALASQLQDDGLLAHDAVVANNPLAPKAPHVTPKAKACIFFFMAGGPSQIDLFDPKPMLNKLNGEKLPESFTKDVQFAFIQKETARAMASPRKFIPHGESGVELPQPLWCSSRISTCVSVPFRRRLSSLTHFLVRGNK